MEIEIEDEYDIHNLLDQMKSHYFARVFSKMKHYDNFEEDELEDFIDLLENVSIIEWEKC